MKWMLWNDGVEMAEFGMTRVRIGLFQHALAHPEANSERFESIEAKLDELRSYLYANRESVMGYAEAYRNGERIWVLGSNGAENRVKGHESSKLDQKHLFSTHLGLIRNLFTLSLRKSVYVIEDCKFLKIRLLPSDHFLMLLFCSVAPQR